MNTQEHVRVAQVLVQSVARIRHAWEANLQDKIYQLTNYLQNLQQYNHRLSLCIGRGWHYAADQCRSAIERSLWDIPYCLQQIQQIQQHTRSKPQNTPTLRSMVEELTALEEEFDDVAWEAQPGVLSAATEYIELEGIDLGRFQIRLDTTRLDNLYRTVPYTVEALDPYPASRNDDVTHPHVSARILCEGDGTISIRNALQDGRISDFFMIVRTILNTYNRESAYVTLDEWHGSSCYECGRFVDDDDRYGCEYCGQDFCCDCASCCGECGDGYCVSHMDQCGDCDAMVCSRCVQQCSECNATRCSGCLDNGLCNTCNSKGNENEEEEAA